MASLESRIAALEVKRKAPPKTIYVWLDAGELLDDAMNRADVQPGDKAIVIHWNSAVDVEL